MRVMTGNRLSCAPWFLALVVAFLTSLRAQTPADFTGTWREDLSKTVYKGRPASGASTPGPDTVSAPVKIKHVAPVYPSAAFNTRVGGVVRIEGTITVDGTLIDLAVVESIPMLDQAALEAVQQWRFKPSMKNGVPTPILMTVTVSFLLDGVSPMRALSTTVITIAQDAQTLTLTTKGPRTTKASVYRLDGSDGHIPPDQPPGIAKEAIARSHWEGAKLVTTIVTQSDTGREERTETRYLQKGHMIVEVVEPNAGGAPPLRSKLVYDRIGGGI